MADLEGAGGPPLFFRPKFPMHIIVIGTRINNLTIKASVTKRRGIGPIRTEISPYKIRKKLFIFQIVRCNGICIWQNYFCILPNFGDFGAKTSLFRYLINQKLNNFIKHCSPPPPCINKPPISEMCIYIRHNLYKWGLDTRGGGGGGTMFYRRKMGGGSAYNTLNTL